MRKAAAAGGVFAFLGILGNEVISVVILAAALLAISTWLLKELSEHNF